MIEVLEERDFPVRELHALASERSVGKQRQLPRPQPPGARARQRSISARLRHRAVLRRRRGVARIRAAGRRRRLHRHRQHLRVPLPATTCRWSCPRSTSHAIDGSAARGIIANPNCSTIQLVVALKPHPRRRRASSASTSRPTSRCRARGARRWRSWREQSIALLSGKGPVETAGRCAQADRLQLRAADRRVPGQRLHPGRNEDRLGDAQDPRHDPAIRVNATAVRVPVFYGHSEAVHIETRR